MRRLAGLVVVIALVAVATLFASRRPVEVTLDLDFGRAAPRQLSLVFTDDHDRVARELTLDYPSGAPPHDRRSVRLPKGHYIVGVRLPETTFGRTLDIDAEGSYSLDLTQRP
jgi:hypothetical protein